jgi:hypothetical protein
MIANSYSSPGTAGGNREDLRDILTILEPEETPVTSMIKKGDAPSSTFIEVLADTLRKPRSSGTREGQDAGKGNNKVAKRQRFGSFVHRVQDEYGVTDVQQAISRRGGVAAINDEYGEAKAKTIREVKRDLEATACSDVEMQGGSDTDMRTRGAFKWVQDTAQATQPVPADFRPAGGDPDSTTSVIKSGVNSLTALTETTVNNICKNLSKIYGGKRDYQVPAGDNITNIIDNFTRTGAATDRINYNQDVTDKRINWQVTLFDSSFARLHMVPTQFNKIDVNGDGDPYAALILNLNLWQMLFLENLHSVDQDENAGGMSGYVKAMFALLCLNPKGNGKIFNT